jgi:hypothetical protein
MNDLLGSHQYGIPINEINNYKNIITEFVPDGRIYEVENIKIPYGTYNIYGIPKSNREVEHQELVDQIQEKQKELDALFEEMNTNFARNK